MPMHDLLQYRNGVLFERTFVGDLRLAVSLGVSTAEARAHVPLCQPHAGDGNGGMRKLSNNCSKFCWILSVKVLNLPRQSCTFRDVFSSFM